MSRRAQVIAARRHRRRRHFELEQARDRRDGPALNEERHEHDEERHVEEQPGAVESGDEREDAQDDRHGAAQPHPRDERLLAPRKAERHETDHHGERPRDDDQDDRGEKRRVRDGEQVFGRREQTQHEKHADLREPREAIVHAQNVLRGMDLPVPHDEARHVDREKAAAADAWSSRQRRAARARRRGGDRGPARARGG